MPNKNEAQMKEKISVPEHGFLSKEIEDALTIIEDSTVGGMGFMAAHAIKKLMQINNVEALLSAVKDKDSKGGSVAVGGMAGSAAGGYAGAKIAAAIPAAGGWGLLAKTLIIAGGAIVGEATAKATANNFLNGEYDGYFFNTGEPYHIFNGKNLETKQQPRGWYHGAPNPQHGQFTFTDKLTDPIKEKQLYFQREMVLSFQHSVPEVEVGDLARLDVAQIRKVASELNSKEAKKFLKHKADELERHEKSNWERYDIPASPKTIHKPGKEFLFENIKHERALSSGNCVVNRQGDTYIFFEVEQIGKSTTIVSTAYNKNSGQKIEQQVLSSSQGKVHNIIQQFDSQGLSKVVNAGSIFSGEMKGATPPVTEQDVYFIVKGDTLSQIAKANDISLKQLLEINPQIKNADWIQAGDKLYIPNEGPPKLTHGLIEQNGFSPNGDSYADTELLKEQGSGVSIYLLNQYVLSKQQGWESKGFDFGVVNKNWFNSPYFNMADETDSEGKWLFRLSNDQTLSEIFSGSPASSIQYRTLKFFDAKHGYAMVWA